jgi:DNA-binding response OmpR family regulator
MNTNILLVEDDPNLSLLVSEYLTIKGYDVTHAADGKKALREITTNPTKYAIVLLDVMMPEMDGFTLAEKLHTEYPDLPIFFLTAKTMLEDKVKGFKLGAEDYLAKPFSLEELALRIEVILRRHVEPENQDFTFGIFHFNPITRVLINTKTNEKAELSTKESEVLHHLVKHPNQLVNRTVILQTVWGDDNYFTARSMDVYLTKIRKYLKADPSVRIQNVHGVGYKLLLDASEGEED